MKISRPADSKLPLGGHHGQRHSNSYPGEDINPIKGTYGVMFVPPERRLKPDSQKAYFETIEAEIKAGIPLKDEKVNKEYQLLGDRYGVGVINHLVTKDLIRLKVKQEADRKNHLEPILSPNGKIVFTESPKKAAYNSVGRLTNKDRMQAIEDSELYSIVDLQAKSSQQSSIAESERNFAKKAHQPMRTTEALQTQDRLAGGRFHVPKVPEPFEEAIMSAPSSSNYNMKTPKMWPAETQFTKSHSRNQHYDSNICKHPNTNTFGKPAYSIVNLKSTIISSNNNLDATSPSHSTLVHPLISANKCSKATRYIEQRRQLSRSQPSLLPVTADDSDSLSSSSVLSSFSVHSSSAQSRLSTLQEALVQCGKLSIVEDTAIQRKYVAVDESIATQKQRLRRHAHWLKHRISGQVVGDDDTIATTSFLSTRVDKIQNLQNTMDELNNGNCSRAPSLGNSNKSTFSTTSHKRYDQALAEHLFVANPNVSLNPFRPTEQQIMRIPISKKPPNPMNPTDYRQGIKTKNLGGYSLIIKPTKMIRDNEIPTRDEVNASLAALSRNATLSYDTRIVETGALTRALQDLRHSSPGLNAVVDLHRAFVDAGCLNPNSWQLNRRQLMTVISDKVPWLDKDAITRLITSYDPQNCGVVRFIRLSASLMCCVRPALTALMSLFHRVNHQKEIKRLKALGLYKDTASDSGDRTDIDDDTISKTSSTAAHLAKEREKLMFLFRLIHGLYEDCEGGVQREDGSGGAKGVGMRIDDVREALSCCVTSIDDELKMNKALEPVIQELFEVGQQTDIIHFNNPNSSITGIHSGSKATDAATADYQQSMMNDDSVSVLSMGGETHYQSVGNLTSSSLMLGGNSIAWQSHTGDTLGDHTRGTIATAVATSFGGPPKAASILKHELLRNTRLIPRVSVDTLLDVLPRHPVAIAEFERQLQRFRELVEPYTLSGTVSYERSVMESISYGTKDGSNRSLMRRPE